VARDADGKVYTVRYEAVNAMLLNEFLKEHRKVEELESTVVQLKSSETQQKDLQRTVARQQKEIQALTAQIQKVKDKVEMSRLARQMALNEQ